jgi:hypothetical protein
MLNLASARFAAFSRRLTERSATHTVAYQCI